MAAFTEQEKTDLIAVFEGMDVKPDTADPESMAQWMKQYLISKGKVTDAPPRSLADNLQPGSTPLIHTPKITVFSGDQTKDARFDIWKYEVLTMIKEKTYSVPIISNAARKSLRGEAARIVMRLGDSATLDEIIIKLSAVYGTVKSSECLLADFYSACQKEKESVATWACRLEDLLSDVDSKSKIKTSDEMLKAKFWSGLLPSLRDASRHKFDTIKEYDNLLIEVRRIESEREKSDSTADKTGKTSSAKTESSKAQVKMSQSTSSEKSELAEIKTMVKSLAQQVEGMKRTSPPFIKSQTFQESAGDSKFTGRTYERGSRGTRRNGRYMGRGRGRIYPWDPQANHTNGSDKSDKDSSKEPISCWRCGKEGHVRQGCRERLN